MLISHMILCSFAISSFVVNTVARETIINGEIAHRANQFPYFASLQLNGSGNHGSRCGAGIINDNFILTAAHCVVDSHNTIIRAPFSILVGTNDLRVTNEPAMRRRVKRIFVPADYSAGQSGIPNADIAVLKLKEPLRLAQNNHLIALELPQDERQSYHGQQAVIAGFGWTWIEYSDHSGTQERGGYNDTLLRYANADVLYECQDNRWKTVLGRRASQTKICARIHQRDRSKPQGVCTGDSGSPLVHNGIVIGIFSTSAKGCEEIEDGGYYSRVAHHLSFIKLAMENKHHKDLRILQLY